MLGMTPTNGARSAPPAPANAAPKAKVPALISLIDSYRRRHPRHLHRGARHDSVRRACEDPINNCEKNNCGSDQDK